MSETIRVGIVGATVTPGGSGWGARSHVPAVKALSSEYDLMAVCTAHADTAEASRDAFGAEVGYSDFSKLVADPSIDLAVVVVRVPKHYDLVMQALQAGKPVYCEWPLGATVEEAERMAGLASERSLRTAVGLQCRSNPTLRYARELIEQGFVGDLVGVTQVGVSQAITERGNGRIWQGDRRNGANTLTISAGHSIDGLCYLAGEFDEVTARLDTKVSRWHNTDTDDWVDVDAPDWINVAGRLQNGAEVAFLVATVPHGGGGETRLELYGTAGSLVVTGPVHLGPNQLLGARAGETLALMDVPERFSVPEARALPAPVSNVAAAYARFFAEGADFQPDFAHAVKRHKLIAAIEQSSAEGRTVKFTG